MRESMSNIRELLSSHDWYYEYSDDNTYFNKGFAERFKIIDILKAMPMNQVRDLILEFCPDDMREVFLLQLQGLRYINKS